MKKRPPKDDHTPPRTPSPSPGNTPLPTRLRYLSRKGSLVLSQLSPEEYVMYLDWERQRRGLSPFSAKQRVRHLYRLERKWEDRPHDAVDYREIAFPPADPLVGESLVIRQGFTILVAREKVGKSLLAAQLALCRAYEEPWLGFRTTPGRTLYINCELPHHSFQQRLEITYEHKSPPPSESFFVRTLWGLPAIINSDEGRELVEREIDEVRPDLVILDPFSNLFAGQENTHQDMQRFLQTLAEWRREYRTAILLVHHFRKESYDSRGNPIPFRLDMMSGHSALRRAADTMIGLTGQPNEPVTDVEFRLRHEEKIPPFQIKRDEYLWYSRTGAVSIPQHMGEAFRRLSAGPISQKD